MNTSKTLISSLTTKFYYTHFTFQIVCFDVKHLENIFLRRVRFAAGPPKFLSVWCCHDRSNLPLLPTSFENLARRYNVDIHIVALYSVHEITSPLAIRSRFWQRDEHTQNANCRPFNFVMIGQVWRRLPASFEKWAGRCHLDVHTVELYSVSDNTSPIAFLWCFWRGWTRPKR